MCPASASSARLSVSRPPITSATVNAAVSPSVSASARLSPRGRDRGSGRARPTRLSRYAARRSRRSLRRGRPARSRIVLGSMNRTASSTVLSSPTSSAPRSRKNSTSSATSSSGALAPDVMPTVSTPSSHASSTWEALSIRCEAAPCSRATSTSRFEFDEFVDPITSTRSASRASSLTAIWRFVVA